MIRMKELLFNPSDPGEKRFTFGAHRSCSPEETLGRFGSAMIRCGVTRLAQITGLDTIGIPVYAAVRPLSRSLVVSLGKGLNPSSAKASALMESIETWHAENLENPLVSGTAAMLQARGMNVVQPELMTATRAGAGIGSNRTHLWLEGYDLVAEDSVWVPAEVVSMDFTSNAAFDGESGLLRSSNGLASGNTVLEAVIHGLYEVVERDAETLWRLSADFRRVDLETVADPACSSLLRRFAEAGVHAAFWDITSDAGVPAYGCVLLEDPSVQGWRPLGVHDGFGCHLSPQVAFVRAGTEAAQTRLTYISGSRDDLGRRELAEARNPALVQKAWDEIAGIPCTSRFPASVPALDVTLTDDLATILSLLRASGLTSVIVVNLTRDDLRIPVVKVIIPGLEGPFGVSRPGRRAAEVLVTGQW